MVILFFIVAMTVAYQADKPCDDACFKAKMEHEANIKREANTNTGLRQLRRMRDI